MGQAVTTLFFPPYSPYFSSLICTLPHNKTLTHSPLVSITKQKTRHFSLCLCHAMPSPPVPSRTLIPSSSRSAVSGPPIRLNSAWAQKVNFLRRKPQELSKDSTLTEENLEEHNLRFQDILEKKCSPYYKGLTDSSLVINKNVAAPNNNNNNNARPASPESHVTARTSSSFLYTVVTNKVQELGSCFGGRSKKRHVETPAAAAAADPVVVVVEHDDDDPVVVSNYSFLSAVVPSPVSPSSGARITLVKEIAKETSIEKPLRERVLLSQDKPKPTAEPEESKQEPTSDRYGLEVEPKSEPSMQAEKADKETNNKVADEKVKYTWADKYRPKSLDQFICNKDKALHLQSLIAGDCGHFIFQGPAGVGKRTMIWAMLAETYGGKVQAREDCKTYDLKGGPVDTIRLNMKRCSERVEVSLADSLGYETLVKLIKEAQTKMSNKAARSTKDTCRAIIIYEAEKLSGDALLYIRWLLERYKGYNKVFFCCSDISKLQPVKNICTIIELRPPSNAEIIEVLKFIAMKESIKLPDVLAERITKNSNNNLRQAIRSFEATSRLCFLLKEDQVIFTGWEENIANIAKNIVKEQSSRQLYTIRNELQNLTEHNVSPEFIFKTLVEELKKHLDEEQHPLLDDIYCEYNINDKSSSIHTYNRPEEIDGKPADPAKCFYKIEEFIAKFMSTYKSLLKKKKMEKDEDSG